MNWNRRKEIEAAAREWALWKWLNRTKSAQEIHEFSLYLQEHGFTAGEVLELTGLMLTGPQACRVSDCTRPATVAQDGQFYCTAHAPRSVRQEDFHALLQKAIDQNNAEWESAMNERLDEIEKDRGHE